MVGLIEAIVGCVFIAAGVAQWSRRQTLIQRSATLFGASELWVRSHRVRIYGGAIVLTIFGLMLCLAALGYFLGVEQ